MKQVSRRRVIATLAAGSAGMALTNLVSSNANASVENNEWLNGTQTGTAMATGGRAFRGQHQPKPLPFDPTKLKGISEKLIRSHWENNYGGAVKALNAVEQANITLIQSMER